MINKNNVLNISNCCTCLSCAFVCPKKAINLNKEHKIEIDNNLCIDCGACRLNCPSINPQSGNNNSQSFYAVAAKSLKIRNLSQSGGAFALIASQFLHKGNVVYGVRFTKNFYASYYRIKNKLNLKPSLRSKYIKANTTILYKSLLNDLLNNKKVLLCGLPCQLNGIINFLKFKNINLNNLYIIDLICHGTMKYSVFNQYISSINFSKIREFSFRDKALGWHSDSSTFLYKFGKYKTDSFSKLYYSNYVLDDSCYACKYTNLNRVGDITIGDFWSIKKVSRDFNDNHGTSAILINNKKGQLLFNSIQGKCKSSTVKLPDILQPSLLSKPLKPAEYEHFWADFNKYGLEYPSFKYAEADLSDVEQLLRKRNIVKRIKRKLRI